MLNKTDKTYIFFNGHLLPSQNAIKYVAIDIFEENAMKDVIVLVVDKINECTSHPLVAHNLKIISYALP